MACYNMAQTSRVTLAPPERKELERRARSRSLAAESVRRAKVILMLAADSSYKEICERVGCAVHYISRLKKRFKEERLTGLDPRCPEVERGRSSAQTEARILEWTRREPTDGSIHWSSYRLAKEVGVSQSTVSRVWRKFGLQRHNSRRYVARDDPEFEDQAADIIGLYLKTSGTRRCILRRREERHARDRSLRPGVPIFSLRRQWYSFSPQRSEQSHRRGAGGKRCT